MPRLAKWIRSAAVVLIACLVGGAGAALADPLSSRPSARPEQTLTLKIADIGYNLSADGRAVESVDLSISGELPGAAGLKYQLEPEGGWSAVCFPQPAGPGSWKVTECAAPKGSTPEGTTRITVVLTKG